MIDKKIDSNIERTTGLFSTVEIYVLKYWWSISKQIDYIDVKFKEWNLVIKIVIIFTIITLIISFYETISTIINITSYTINWFQTIVSAIKIENYNIDCKYWFLDKDKIKWCNFMWYFNGKLSIIWTGVDNPEYRTSKLLEDNSPINIVSIIAKKEPSNTSLLYKKINDKLFLSKERISFVTWEKDYFNRYNDEYDIQFFSLITTKNKNDIDEKKILFVKWLFNCSYAIEHEFYIPCIDPRLMNIESIVSPIKK